VITSFWLGSVAPGGAIVTDKDPSPDIVSMYFLDCKYIASGERWWGGTREVHQAAHKGYDKPRHDRATRLRKKHFESITTKLLGFRALRLCYLHICDRLGVAWIVPSQRPQLIALQFSPAPQG
jgi:hypothetical protein